MPAACARFDEDAVVVAKLGAARAVGVPRPLDPVQRVVAVRRFELAAQLATRAGRNVPERDGSGPRIVVVGDNGDAGVGTAVAEGEIGHVCGSVGMVKR